MIKLSKESKFSLLQKTEAGVMVFFPQCNLIYTQVLKNNNFSFNLTAGFFQVVH